MWKFFWCAACKVNVITDYPEPPISCPSCWAGMEYRFGKDDAGLSELLAAGTRPFPKEAHAQ